MQPLASFSALFKPRSAVLWLCYGYDSLFSASGSIVLRTRTTSTRRLRTKALISLVVPEVSRTGRLTTQHNYPELQLLQPSAAYCASLKPGSASWMSAQQVWIEIPHQLVCHFTINRTLMVILQQAHRLEQSKGVQFDGHQVCLQLGDLEWWDRWLQVQRSREVEWNSSLREW